MTRAVMTLCGPTRVRWVRAGAAAASLLTFAPLGWVAARGFVECALAVALSSVAAAFMLRLVASRIAGIGANHVVDFALKPTLLLTTVMACSVLRWTHLRSSGEGYADTIWSQTLIGIVVCLPFCVPFGVGAGAQRTQGREASVDTAKVAWLAVLLVVVASASVRSFTQRPFIRATAWLRELPVVGAIPAATPSPGRERWQIGDTVVRRDCEPHLCELSIDTSATTHPFRQMRAAREAAELRYDARHDALVFVSSNDRHALRRATGAYVNLRLWHMNLGRAPPRPWVIAALVGLVSAGLLRVYGRRAPASLLRWRSACAGTLAGDGTVTLDDGSVARPVAPHALAPGPVLVFVGPLTKPALPFRGASVHEALAVAAVTRADVDDAITHLEVTADSLALTLATTTCAPLLVEAVCQLAG